MSEKEAEKSSIIKLDEHQFQHLVITFSNITKELGNMTGKVGKLETAIANLEGELKLIRMEISELKQKK